MSKLMRWILMRLAWKILEAIKELLEDLLARDNGDNEDAIITRRSANDKRTSPVA